MPPDRHDAPDARDEARAAGVLPATFSADARPALPASRDEPLPFPLPPAVEDLLAEEAPTLRNGGFEEGDGETPAAWDVSGARRDCADAAEGACSLVLPHEGNVTHAAQAVPHDPEAPDDHAFLVIRIRDPDARGYTDSNSSSYLDNWFRADVRLDPVGPEGPRAMRVEHVYLLTSPAPDWIEIEVGPVPVPAGTEAVVVHFEAHGTGGATRVDDVRLVVAPAPAQRAQNPGFEEHEDDAPSGWRLGDGARLDCDESHAGSCSARLDRERDDARLSQEIPTQEAAFELLFDVWYQASGNATLGVRHQILDGNGTVTSEWLADRIQVGNGTDGWRHHRIPPTSATWGASVRVVVEVLDAASGVVVRVDDVAVQFDPR